MLPRRSSLEPALRQYLSSNHHGLTLGFIHGLTIVMVILPWLALAGCDNQPEESNSLVTMLENWPGCTTTCWLGIVPGLSTEADFAKIAEANPERFDDLKRNAFGSKFVQFIWRDRVLNSIMALELDSNVVTHLSMQFESNLSLQTALEELGPAEAYASHLSIGELPTLLLYLFYESRGAVVEVAVPPSQAQIEGCHYDLPDSLVVKRLYLTPPATAQATLDSLPHLFPSQLSPSPWIGLDNLELSACAL